MGEGVGERKVLLEAMSRVSNNNERFSGRTDKISSLVASNLVLETPGVLTLENALDNEAKKSVGRTVRSAKDAGGLVHENLCARGFTGGVHTHFATRADS